MSFWSDASMTSTPPKRNYRWILLMGGVPQWIIKKVNKPGFTISEATHQYLNHTFYYPGRVEYEKTSVTLVDPVTPDATAIMMEILNKSGYAIPMLPENTQTIAKNKAVNALGNLTVSQIDSDGVIVDQFTFLNAWLTSAKFGDLDYSNDDLVEISIEIRYDFVSMPVHGETDFGMYVSAEGQMETGGERHDIFSDF